MQQHPLGGLKDDEENPMNQLQQGRSQPPVMPLPPPGVHMAESMSAAATHQMLSVSSDQQIPPSHLQAAVTASLNPTQAQPQLPQCEEALNHPFDNLEGVDLPDYVKTHDTNLTFPEKLMLMLMHIEQEFSSKGKVLKNAPIAWAMQGKAFVIRERDQFIKKWLPLFFRHAKFSSFTRKLYRWGFRQISSPRGFDSSSDRELYFFNPNFQKNQKHLLSNMSSVTAETRRQQQRRESISETNVGFPLSLNQYPFGVAGASPEAKDQFADFNLFSNPTVLSQLASLGQQPSGGGRGMHLATQPSGLDFVSAFNQSFGFVNQNSLSNALASQLAAAGPSALFGLQQQQYQHQQPNSADLGFPGGGGDGGSSSSPMPSMYPQSLQQQLNTMPQLSALSAAAVQPPTVQRPATSELASTTTPSQLTLSQLHLLTLAQQQRQAAASASGNTNSASAATWSNFASAFSDGLSSTNSAGQYRQQQHQNNQASNQLANLVMRYGASNLQSLRGPDPSDPFADDPPASAPG